MINENEWYDCPTMADLVKAQEAGYEIEVDPETRTA